MIQERYKPTFLRKLFPNTKLWMCVGLSITIVALGNTWYSMVVLFGSVALIFREKYYLEFKVVAVAIILMALSMFLINGTLNPVNDYTGEPVFVIPLPFLVVRFYREGLLYALKFFRRIAPLMAALFLLFRTMNMTDLGVAMNMGGLPYRASFIFITTFQSLPQLNKEMHQIMDAQRARGLETEGNLWKRFSSFIPIMVPVVANSIMKVQQQAIALETRGFNAPAEKTIYRDLGTGAADHVLKWTSIVASVGAIVYRIVVTFFPHG
jgi:energy-coupling factor transport system permease protein